MVKDISFKNDAREKLREGIKTIAAAVGSTLGPLGNTVIIEDGASTRGVKVTKDGVTVAKSIHLEDPVQDLAVNIVREAAERTARQAGDGTTTSIVLSNALVDAGLEVIKHNPAMNVTNFLKELRKDVDRVVDHLEGLSVPVNPVDYEHIATISANNDAEIGSLVAKAYDEVGASGVVTFRQDRRLDKSEIEVTDGIRLRRGHTFKGLITDQNGTCELNNPYIFLCDSEVNNYRDVSKLFDGMQSSDKNKRPILFISPVSQNFIGFIAKNHHSNENNMGWFKAGIIEPPSFGYKSTEIMQDLALVTGGKFFNEKEGDNLTNAKLSMLGEAEKVIIGPDGTVIIPKPIEDDDTKKEIKKRLKKLAKERENSDNEGERQHLADRLAVLDGKMATILVGAGSESEAKEVKDRIEDAVLAVESSKKRGILPGGGTALQAAAVISAETPVLREALLAPIKMIYGNGEMTPPAYQQWGQGRDLSKNVSGDMIDMGVIDPAEVTIQALRNAFSVASTILSTSTVVNNKRQNG